MRAEGGSPNLINGVSRQPAEVRLPSQLEESINQFPTVTRGLVPRNPARLKGVMASTQPENSTTHLIDRDDAEQYVVTVNPNGVEVTDLSGNVKTVNAPSGWGYLAGAQDGDLEALTVADHTFILNKRKVVQAAAVKTPQFQSAGLVHIVQGDYHTDYSILIDGVERARYTTDGGPYETEGNARSAERGARPGVISSMLTYGGPPNGLATIPPNPVSYLISTLGGGWGVGLYDNVIHIVPYDGRPFSLEVRAGSETKARAHKGVSQDFSELPRKAPHGFCLKISGDEDTGYDDYYVRFDQSSGAAQGRWKETVGPDIGYKLDPATMPHILVREANGTFTFKPATWGDREVGDLETNPWPSFVDRTIDGMVFFKNRVGFISGESCSMSRHGDFFNFFIESILTQLDTDPVDIAISYPEISNINYAVPFSGEMIMFTSSVPFRLASGDLFTPKSANFEHVLSNSVSSKVRPVTAGKYLYFVNDVESGCFVHEFAYDREVGVKEAPCISDHVNGYIPSGVRLMAVEEDLNTLVLVSDKDPNTIYLYKWLWIGTNKAQSAWQKWKLDSPIVGFKFYGEELIVVTKRATTREILSINCHEAWQDTGSTIYLDRRVDVTGVYNATNDSTTWTLPYPASGAKIVTKSPYGIQPTFLQYAGNQAAAPGNLAGAAFGGFEYESSGELSPLHYRPPQRDGGYGNAEAGVETTIANVTFQCNDTVHLDVSLERDYRKPFLYRLSSALIGTKTGRLGVLVVGQIKKALSIMAKSEDFRLIFKNRGPYAYSVQSYKWTGDVRPISY